MKRLIKTILLIASIGVFYFTAFGFAQTSTESVEAFFPKKTVTDAVYVQIENDPALDDFGRRMKEAREKNPEWFNEYSKQHQKPGFAPLPYHKNFGVSKKEYEHFIQPMNHFREIKRTQIKISRSIQNGYPQLDFQGENLLLTRLVFNLKDQTAQTQLDILPRLTFVDLESASLPPGRHKGVLYRTPDAKIAASKKRESLLIGELKDKNSGIIHYSLNIPGEVKRIYIQFPK